MLYWKFKCIKWKRVFLKNPVKHWTWRSRTRHITTRRKKRPYCNHVEQTSVASRIVDAFLDASRRFPIGKYWPNVYQISKKFAMIDLSGAIFGDLPSKNCFACAYYGYRIITKKYNGLSFICIFIIRYIINWWKGS